MAASGTVKWFQEGSYPSDSRAPLLVEVDMIKEIWAADAERRELEGPAEQPLDPTTAEINRLAIASAVSCAS